MDLEAYWRESEQAWRDRALDKIVVPQGSPGRAREYERPPSLAPVTIPRQYLRNGNYRRPALPPPPEPEMVEIEETETETELEPIERDVLDLGAPPPITCEDIKRTVCLALGVTKNQLHGHMRKRHVADARHLAMFLTHGLTRLTLPHIGQKMGGKDHTTVLHAIRKIARENGLDHSRGPEIEAKAREIYAELSLLARVRSTAGRIP